MKSCSICRKPMGDYEAYVPCGAEEKAHRHCYARNNPPQVATTLLEAVRGCGDPILAAEIISEMVPHDLAANIVAKFNRRSREQWLRRCEEC